MKIDYCPVSTNDQNPDWQLAALKRAECERIFIHKASGATTKRPELTACLTALNAGDVLTGWKLDRRGRSLRDLIGLLDDLKAWGIAFQSLTEAIDTATPTGRARWQMVRILAELERSLHSGTHESRQSGGKSSWRKNGPQAVTVRTTDRPRPQTDRAGGTPRRCGKFAEGLAVNDV